jgi:hypothetical protein
MIKMLLFAIIIFTIGMLSFSHVAKSQESMATICKRDGQTMAEESFDKDYMEAIERGNLETSTNLILRKHHYSLVRVTMDAWRLLAHPSVDIRKKAYTASMKIVMMKNPNKADKSEDLRAYLIKQASITKTEFKKDRKERKPRGPFKYEALFFGLKLFHNLNTAVKGSGVKVFARSFCKRYKFIKNSTPSECAKSTRRVIRTMKTRLQKGGYQSLPFETKKIFWSTKYRIGILKAALKVLKRIEEAERRYNDHNLVGLSNGNIFTDIHTAFIKSGFSNEEALNASMMLLGLYGSRGAAIGVFYNSAYKTNYEVFVAMSVISVGMNYLDLFYNLNSGNSYFLPPGVSSGCLYGKPYHFWLSAYLSRKMISQYKLSKEGAVLGTNIMANLYEFKPGTRDRKPTNTIFSDNDYLNSLRMNTVYHWAGSIFGANINSERQNKIKIDESLSQMFEHQSGINRLPKGIFKQFAAFNRVLGTEKIAPYYIELLSD